MAMVAWAMATVAMDILFTVHAAMEDTGLMASSEKF